MKDSGNVQGKMSSHSRRLLVLVATILASGATIISVPALSATAATHTPVEAEGNSYALAASVTLLAGSPINVGPIAPATADVPSPPNPKFNHSGVVTCGPLTCVGPVVDSLNVLDDTSKAFVPGYNGAGASTPKTDCLPTGTLPPGFVAGPPPLKGGNGCSNIANVGLLGGLLGVGLPGGIVANGINTQSLTQTCTGTPTNGGQLGITNIVSLKIGATTVAIPKVITPNTTINLLGLGKVILDEQKFENLSGGIGGGKQTGHGLIVNAVHIILNIPAVVAADVIIGHASSRAVCAETVPPECTPTSTDPACQGIKIDKTVVTPQGSSGGGGVPIAKPGDQVTYTIKFANVTNCTITKVVDTLPPGFTFVSASGDLGSSPTVGTVGGQQTVTFQSAGFPKTPDPLVEKIVAVISANEPAGRYIDGVDVLSSCGENVGSGGEVQVPGRTPGTPTPTPTPAAAGPPVKNLPNTSAAQPIPVGGIAALMALCSLLGLGLLVRSRVARGSKT